MRDTCRPKWQKVCETITNLRVRQNLISLSTHEKLLTPIQKMEFFGEEMENYLDKLAIILKTSKTEQEILDRQKSIL